MKKNSIKIYSYIGAALAILLASIPFMGRAALSLVVDPVANVSGTQVVFKGSYAGAPVNSKTDVFFSYGERDSGGNCNLSPQTGVQTFSLESQSFEFLLTNLNLNTQYCFRGSLINNSASSARVDAPTIGIFTTGSTSTGTGSNNTTVTGTVSAVQTLGAVFVTNKTATLGGYVSGSGTTAVSFEYGTSTNGLTQKTGEITSFDTNRNVSLSIADLSPTTTYYYRAIARGVNTAASGQILSFKTGSVDGVVGTTMGDQSDETNSPDVIGIFTEADDIPNYLPNQGGIAINTNTGSNSGRSVNVFDQSDELDAPVRRGTTIVSRPRVIYSTPSQRVAYTYQAQNTVIPAPEQVTTTSPLIITPEPIRSQNQNTVAFNDSNRTNSNSKDSLSTNTRGAAAALFGTAGLPGVFTFLVIIALIIGIILVIRFILIDRDEKSTTLSYNETLTSQTK